MLTQGGEMSAINPIAGSMLDTQRSLLAEMIMTRYYKQVPESKGNTDAYYRAKSLQDVNYHLAFLAEAITISTPSLFTDYVAWAKVLLHNIGLPPEDFRISLECMRDVLREALPAETRALAVEYIQAGLVRLPQFPTHITPFIVAQAPLGILAQLYLAALLRADRRQAHRLILDAVQAGTKIKDLYLHVFQRAQRELGRLWQINQISVAQEHYCTAATQLIMSELYPYIFATQVREHKMVATCVGDELHEIGVRMVADFFEMEGWDTLYLGANMPAPSVVRAVIEHKADILGISATMTFHVGAVAKLIETVRANPACQHVKILVGGYPFIIADQLWQQVGADGFAVDAQEAITVAQRLLESEAA
jgi:MerR family transcriptional regulator, light-induced transcriptional regulator